MEPSTYFASPERASLTEARRQAAAIRRNPGLRRLASGLPDLLVVLNPQRQIVFANRSMEDFLESIPPESICGRRPGELLGCIHAEETAGGCGTARSCRYCGAVRAILDTQRYDRPSSEECTISAGRGQSLRAYNFRVTTTPLEIGSRKYVLLSLRDISAEKHRQALQRVFFHDLLNTVSGLKAHLELLRRQAEAEGCRDTIGRLERIGDQLVEEIRSQKLLVSAEARTLEVQRDLVVSGALAQDLLETLAAREASGGATLELAPIFESVSFISDEAILRRVLTNMIKNALEASTAGETVQLGCRREEGAVVFRVHNPAYMEPAVQEQVFQRFFTTKEAGRGLGTYSMKLLGEEYLGGRVGFESSADGGTTFSVSLPGGIF